MVVVVVMIVIVAGHGSSIDEIFSVCRGAALGSLIAGI
jgi:hypothetical protein